MLSFVDSCDGFYKYLLNERNLSPRTINTYKEGLDKFECFLKEKGIENIESISSELIRSYIAWLRVAGKSPSSVNTWLAAIKSLYKYLQVKNLVLDDPTLSIGSLKKNKRLPEFFSNDQMSFLLDQPSDEGQISNSLLNSFLSLRDSAMIELMYSSGLRVSEVVSLDLSRVYIDARQVKVIGKGNKERIVPFGIPALKALQEYLKVRALYALDDEEAVFINQTGTRTTTRNVEMRMKVYAKTHNFGKNIYPHKLRHSFATAMVSNSHNVRAVQELLGHERLSTTQIYSHTDIAALARIYEQAHPRDKMEQRQNLINKADSFDDFSQ